MGAGFSDSAAIGLANSLTTLFNQQNIPDLKQYYSNLQKIHPSFMQYTARPVGGDRRAWRTSTLRFAGLLLSSNVKLDYQTTAPKDDYPGRTFIKWLKWLTWVQTLGHADAVVTINTVLAPTITPAQAILDTLSLALQDTSTKPINPVVFKWSEIPQGGLMTVTVTQTPPYSVTVESIRADDIAIPISDNDEDKQIP
jgi:hypothetical protein